MVTEWLIEEFKTGRTANAKTDLGISIVIDHRCLVTDVGEATEAVGW